METKILIVKVVFFLIFLLIASLVAGDATKRGMSAWGWGLIVFFLTVIGLIVYFIARKPKLEKRIQSETPFDEKTKALYDTQKSKSTVPEFLKSKGYTVEARDNLAVKGNVILYNSQEYEIKQDKANKTELKLVIPTKTRLLYSIPITIVVSILLSMLTKGLVVLGLLFLLMFTYVVDYFYKKKREATTIKINKELSALLKEYER